MQQLPDELVDHISQFVPIQSVGRLRSTSKQLGDSMKDYGLKRYRASRRKMINTYRYNQAFRKRVRLTYVKKLRQHNKNKDRNKLPDYPTFCAYVAISIVETASFREYMGFQGYKQALKEIEEVFKFHDQFFVDLDGLSGVFNLIDSAAGAVRAAKRVLKQINKITGPFTNLGNRLVQRHAIQALINKIKKRGPSNADTPHKRGVLRLFNITLQRGQSKI